MLYTIVVGMLSLRRGGRGGAKTGQEGQWSYDTVVFTTSIRKSGGSLVVTIPAELAKRFMISEGQKVNLVGVYRAGLQFEGGVLVYLGRFFVRERAVVVRVEVEGSPDALGDVPDVVESLASRYSASSFIVNEKGEGVVECEIVLSSISETGVVKRRKDEAERLLKEFETEMLVRGLKLVRKEVLEEDVEWSSVDPAIINRYTVKLPGNMSLEWRLE